MAGSRVGRADLNDFFQGILFDMLDFHRFLESGLRSSLSLFV